jgi:hypothetical protein
MPITTILLVIPVAAGIGQEPQLIDASKLPRYDLVVEVKLGAPSLTGTARITLPPSDAPRDSIPFALGEQFDVSRAELRVDDRVVPITRVGKKERRYDRPGWGTITWSLISRDSIPAGKPVRLDVSFSTDSTAVKANVFSIGRDAAFASGQNTAWYPAIEEAEPHPAGRLRALRATATIEFVLDTGVSMYFPGTRVSRRVEGSRQRLRYQTSFPMFFGFGVGRFTQTGGTYYLKPRASARTNDSLALRVLRVLEREFGPLRFPDFAVVEVPSADADSAGFAGASADGFILATSDFLDRPFNTAYYGHEIAHQWWGVMMRVTGSRGGWLLSEAISQWGSLRAVEELDPPELAERYRRDEYPGYLGQGAREYFDAVSKGHDAPLLDLPFDWQWSRAIADSKGFMAWNALSLLIGRETFRRALTAMTAKYSTSRYTWDVFVRELSAHTTADVRRFVADWFERPGIPEWEVRSDSRGAAIVQLGQPYLASVRVDVITTSCPRQTQRVLLLGSSTRLPTPAPGCGPATYAVDPEYEIIHWTPELRRRWGVQAR